MLTACLLAGGPALLSAGRFFPVGPDSDGLSLVYKQNQNNYFFSNNKSFTKNKFYHNVFFFKALVKFNKNISKKHKLPQIIPKKACIFSF